MNYLIDTLYDLSRKSGKPAQRRWSVGRGSDGRARRVPAARATTRISAPGAIRTDYWNWGVGFISAYPPDQFIMLEKGATYGTQDTQIWAPYYTLHKILAGLLDSYEVGGNKKALEIAQGHGRVGARAPEGAAARDARQHVGPLHRRRVRRHERSDGAPLPAHGRPAVPRVREAVRQHRLLLRQREPRRPAWRRTSTRSAASTPTSTSRRSRARSRRSANTKGDAVLRRSPRTSGTSSTTATCTASAAWPAPEVPNNAECFTAEPNSLWQNGFASGGQNETCATYNLLKLDRQLFMYDQTAKYMDHYERALYNHILASVAESDAGNTYHVPLNPGAQKRFGNADMSGFTCCNGTALESNTKLQDSIYFHSADNQALYVNLFISSTLNWSERNGRAAGHRFPLRRHDEAHRQGERAVRRQGARAAVGHARLLREDQRPRAAAEGRAGHAT